MRPIWMRPVAELEPERLVLLWWLYRDIHGKNVIEAFVGQKLDDGLFQDLDHYDADALYFSELPAVSDDEFHLSACIPVPCWYNHENGTRRFKYNNHDIAEVAGHDGELAGFFSGFFKGELQSDGFISREDAVNFLRVRIAKEFPDLYTHLSEVPK